MNYLTGQYGMSYHRVSYSQSVYTSTKLSTSDYYPFGSLMPGRTVMDTTVHCVDMTQIDRVWQPAYENGLPFNSLFSEMSPWGAASYELSSDPAQLDLFIEDEQSGIKLLLDSGIGSGSLMLEGKVSNITDRGIVLRVQGVDAEGNGVVYHQEHLGQFDGKLEIPLDSAYSDYVVNIQGLLHWSILDNEVVNGHWIETEVLVRVCDEVGDQYRFGFNGQEKVNEIAGMGNHNTAEFWEYDTRLGRRWNRDPVVKAWESSYSTFARNPIWKNDIYGDLESTHTDEKGNVVDVKNDGNLGIYQHSDSEIAAFKTGNGELNIKPGKEIGNTLYENSFDVGDKIDFGSYRAQIWINNFEREMKQAVGPKFLRNAVYAINAKNGGLFDPKSYLKDGVNGGSQISKGIYISNRDLGNYAAGAFGRITGWNKKDMMLDYGAFQLSNNKLSFYIRNRNELRLKAINFKDVTDRMYADPTQKTYGEDPRSNWFQRLGFEGIRTLSDFNKNYNKVLDD